MGYRNYVNELFKFEYNTILVKEKHPERKSYYICHCSVCSTDDLLFPHGSITSKISHLKSGQLPCGCSRKPQYKEFQYKILCERFARDKEVIFKGWSGDYNKTKTKVVFINKRGDILVYPLSSVLWPDQCLPKNLEVSRKDNQIKTTKSILSTIGGTFMHYVDGHYKNYYSRFIWRCSCKEVNNSSIKTFNSGSVVCSGCGKGLNKSKNLTGGWFYIVRWYGFCEEFIKIGYTSIGVENRIAQQYGKGKLDYNILYKRNFNTVEQAKALERDIKYIYKDSMGVCPYEWLPDGYTETLPISLYKNVKDYSDKFN